MGHSARITRAVQYDLKSISHELWPLARNVPSGVHLHIIYCKRAIPSNTHSIIVCECDARVCDMRFECMLAIVCNGILDILIL